MVLYWWLRFEVCIELWSEMIIYRLYIIVVFKGWDIILKLLIFYLLVILVDLYSNIIKYIGFGVGGGGGGKEILRINFDIVFM